MAEKKKETSVIGEGIKAVWIGIAYFLKALKLIGKALAYLFKGLHRKKKKAVGYDLLYRLEHKERVNPLCKYADCLVSLNSCSLLEKCITEQLRKKS
jgi:hypothetical protein